MSVAAPPPAPPETHAARPSRNPAAPPFHRNNGRLDWRRVAAAVFALWILSGFYMVPADEQAVETRFGRVVDERVEPGVHYNTPWPAGRVFRLKVRQLQRGVVGGEIVDSVIGTADPLQSQFLTGDQNIINVRTVVQYSVAVPRRFLFRSQGAQPIVLNVVEAELGRQIAARTVDEVLTTEKVAIQEVVRRRAQTLLDAYELGVAISTVSIESVAAPPEAADAFRDVASARADSARIVNEAQGYANDIVPRARGEAHQMLQAAEAYRERSINRARGDAARFQALAAEYAKNPEVTRSRLYFEAMEEILPRIEKTIVDDAGNIDLTIIRRKSGAPAEMQR